MKNGYVWILHGCIYYKTFGYGMIMLLRSADLYLRCGWLGTECLGEFALFLSGGIHIIDTCKLWTPSGGDPSNGVDPQSSPSGDNPISGAANSVGL